MQKLEQQLINDILSGDKNAFELLFKTYYSSLVLIAKDILWDSRLAEETVQDVFVKLWKNANDLSINTSLSSYLVSMVRNRSIDYLRAKARQIKTVSIENWEIQAKLHDLGIGATFDEELFPAPLEIALKQALEQLPPQCKQIFVLNRFDGYTPKEISKMLDISTSTVKTQITRALLKLKETISLYLK